MLQFQFERGPLILPIKKKWGDKIATLGFIVQQYIYVTLFAFVALPGFFFKWYLTFLLLFYTFIVIKNGGDYYIHYFSENYEIKIKIKFIFIFNFY